MHRLERASVSAPPCLALYRHGANNWDDVTLEHKQEIRQHLQRMQGRRCAYCEGSIDLLGQHIEHFRRKNAAHFPQLTFEWTNLFWSCNQDGHCGCFKDRRSGPYDPNDLIDPSLHDPEVYLRFSSDGRIRLLRNLTIAEQHRARETLRVFNLDHEHGPLRRMRESHCAGYVALGAEIAELAAHTSPDEWQAFFDDEIEHTRELPFATAIKHTLTPE